MLIETSPGHHTAGEADAILIAQVGAVFHVVLLEERPMPGVPRPIPTLPFIRLKSSMSSPPIATFAEAQAAVAELREKITIADANVSQERALFVGEEVLVFAVANWIAREVPFATVLFWAGGFPEGEPAFPRGTEGA